ncbi:MAG: hypothetical protein ACN6I6_00865 [bacterium]
MKLFFIAINIVFLTSCSSISGRGRTPASLASDDPCKQAMQEYFYRLESGNTSYVDEVIDADRVIDSARISHEDILKIENSSEWNDFISTIDVSASLEEKQLIAAMLRKADPDAPTSALQRKFGLLFEFCGL